MASASVFVANAHFLLTTGGYVQPSAQLNPFLHTWTLSVEEQFYLAFPLVLVVCWRAGRDRAPRWLVGTLVGALVASFAIGLVLSYEWPPAAFAWFRHEARAARLAFFTPMARAGSSSPARSWPRAHGTGRRRLASVPSHRWPASSCSRSRSPR